MAQPVIILKLQGAGALNAIRENPEMLGNAIGGNAIGGNAIGGNEMGGNLVGGDNGIVLQSAMGGQTPIGQGMAAKPVAMKTVGGKAMAIQLGQDGAAQTVMLQGVGGRGIDLEGTRIMLTKNGALIRAGEIENGRLIISTKPAAAKGAGLKAAAAKGAAANGVAAKGAMAKGAVAGGAVAQGSMGGAQAGVAHGPVIAGTSTAGKGVGVGLGLGSMGPIVLLGAIGLVATGVYLYLKSRHYEDEDFHDDEEFAAA